MSLGYIGEPLPQEWCTPFLSELTTPKQWKTISTKSLLSEGYTVYGANGKIGYFNQYTHEHPTIMITCRGATCGNLHISEPFSYINGNAMALDGQPTALVGLKFLYFALKARGLEDTISGSAQPQITGKGLSEVRLPLPPLAEQKVIADKLDTLLAQVENTKARLERVPQILKRFRQSVLAAAVSGRLTEEWRNGAEFEVESDALSKFVSIDIGHAFKSKEFTDRGISLLRGQNIEPGALRWSETKYFPEAKLSEFRHLFINSGDIVLAMDRPIISSGLKIARAKPSDLPCVLVQRVARFKDFNDLLPDYLYVLLQDISFSNYIQPNQTGSDIPHISGKQILAYPVEIPSIEEQTEIVRRVDQLFAHADRIEQQVNNALARVNNLTQSILAKAFRGELTEQWRKDNPELISGEKSAAALLERIKAERAAITPTKSTRKSKANV
ncbi:MAG: restriction endonuclease subunit S [Natronospirillum sp.]